MTLIPPLGSGCTSFTPGEPLVTFIALARFFQGKSVDAAEVNQRHAAKKSGQQKFEIADQTLLELASGKSVLQKIGSSGIAVVEHTPNDLEVAGSTPALC